MKSSPRSSAAAIGRWLAAVVDRADFLLTLARLWVLDRVAPMPETPADRAIREDGERLRKAFPWLDERQAAFPEALALTSYERYRLREG
jgi:hypothetical protein